MAGLKLTAELGGDGSGFDAMMRRANSTKDKFGQSFAGLKNVIAGVFTIGAITSMSRKTLELAGHLRDVSDALSVNVEWFQKRANAAKLAGGSEDDIAKFIGNMSKAREDAVNNPSGETAQRFGRMGFSGQDISGLNTMDFFDKMVKSYASGANTQANVDVEKIGGRAAKNLLAAFKSGLDGGGPVMSEDIINQLDEVGDAFEIFKQTFMVGFAPVIVGVTNALTTLINKARIFMAAVGGEKEGHVRKQMLENMAKSGDLSVRMFAKAQLKEFNANGGVEGWGDNAIEQEIKRQQDEQARIKAGREAERAARKSREQSGPGFDEFTDSKKAKASRSASLSTDALVGVGNFLGRNPALVNTVANQQLQVSRQQVKFAEMTYNILKDRLTVQMPGFGTINVPRG